MTRHDDITLCSLPTRRRARAIVQAVDTPTRTPNADGDRDLAAMIAQWEGDGWEATIPLADIAAHLAEDDAAADIVADDAAYLALWVES